jgi:hypothetical protein
MPELYDLFAPACEGSETGGMIFRRQLSRRLHARVGQVYFVTIKDKAARRRIRRWGQNPESVGECPHLSGARGVGRISQGDFEFELNTAYIGAYIGGRRPRIMGYQDFSATLR